MIITCESCATRFQLEDARIPDEGVKVRCSRCKNAFVVKRPDLEAATDDQAVEELGANPQLGAPDQTLGGPEPGAEPSENATHALSDSDPTELLGRMDDPPAPRREEGDEESDWEFNEDPQEEGAPEPEPGLSVPETDAGTDAMSELFGAEPAAATPSIEELGSPEEWDLLAGEGEPESPPQVDEGALEDPPGDEGEPAPEPSAPTPAPAEREAPTAEIETQPPVLELDAAGLEPRVTVAARALGVSAWIGVAILVAVVARAALFGHAEIPRSAPVALQLAGGLRAESLQGRIVENALSGPLLVVSGRIRNPGPEPRILTGPLQVQLLDDSGSAVAQPSPVAAAPSVADLRTATIENLVVRLERDASVLAQMPLAPGESIAVAAVMPPPGSDVWGFRLEPGRALSSGSSPPTPHPSSE